MRYIDADKLVESLRADYDRDGEKADTYAVNGDVDLAVKYSHGQFCYLNAMERVKDAPTADVAPRAEVANKICCEIEEEIVAALESNYRARREHIERYAELAYDTELLLEINGKINALRGIEAFVEELKKKYTEGQK